LFEIPESPQVVVADEEVYRYPAVGYLGEFTQQATTTLRHTTAVFEPKIENITDEEYLRSVSAHRIEPCYEALLVLSSIVYDIGADMCIG
jgi:hypothetical protein